MDETRQLLHAIIKNQEIARAETKGGFDRVDAEIRNIYRQLGEFREEVNARFERNEAEFREFKSEMLEFKSDSAMEFKQLNLRMDSSDFEKIKQQRTLSGIELDLDKTIFRVSRLEEHFNNNQRL